MKPAIQGSLRVGVALLALANVAGCDRAASRSPARGTPAPATSESPPPQEKAAPASAPSGPQSAVEGTVGGTRLTVASAIFSWRAGADDMQIFLSDASDLCATLTAGAWPRQATILAMTLKLTGKDNRDGPFRAGAYPVRAGTRHQPQEVKRATFMRLDPRCTPAQRASASAGTVTLTTPAVAVGGTATGTFELTIGSDRLSGRFSAGYCKPPEEEPSGCR